MRYIIMSVIYILTKNQRIGIKNIINSYIITLEKAI